MPSLIQKIANKTKIPENQVIDAAKLINSNTKKYKSNPVQLNKEGYKALA